MDRLVWGIDTISVEWWFQCTGWFRVYEYAVSLLILWNDYGL